MFEAGDTIFSLKSFFWYLFVKFGGVYIEIFLVRLIDNSRDDSPRLIRSITLPETNSSPLKMDGWNR